MSEKLQLSQHARVSRNDNLVHLKVDPRGHTHEPSMIAKTEVSVKEGGPVGRDQNETRASFRADSWRKCKTLTFAQCSFNGLSYMWIKAVILSLDHTWESLGGALKIWMANQRKKRKE